MGLKWWWNPYNIMQIENGTKLCNHQLPDQIDEADVQHQGQAWSPLDDVLLRTVVFYSRSYEL